MLLLGRYTLHWRQSIRTNINVNDAAYGQRSISYARSDSLALTAGAFLHTRQHHHAGLVSVAIFAVEAPCSQRNRNRSDCNSILILRHPSQSRWISSSRLTTRDPDMRQCNSVGELAQMAYEHLDVLSPRGKSAFWTILSKLLQNRGGRPSETNHKQCPIEKQLDTLLRSTLDGMHAFDYRDIATTALCLAKIVIQVGPSRGKKHTTGNPHQILHDRLIGVKSENKRFIFGEIAISSIPVLPKFEARHLSNLIYAYGLAECIPTKNGGRAFFDLLVPRWC